MRIRSTHRHSFRTGEWAVLVGIELREVNAEDNPRPCYLVVFPDGVCDSWPVYDYKYEFRIMQPGEKVEHEPDSDGSR